MSKLFDQLKNAARNREERSPGLLLEALQKARSGAPAPEAAAAQPPRARSPAVETTVPVPEAQSRPAATANGSYVGIALAVAIFAAVVLAWNAAPWRAPQRIKIDPAGLKLDRTLDLQRPSAKGTTSPSRPS